MVTKIASQDAVRVFSSCKGSVEALFKVCTTHTVTERGIFAERL